MAKFIHLEFADGSTESFPLVAADIVKTTRKYGQDIDGHAEAGLYAAWCAVVRLKQTTLEFDDWLENVAEVRDRPGPLAPSNVASLPSLPPAASRHVS